MRSLVTSKNVSWPDSPV